MMDDKERSQNLKQEVTKAVSLLQQKHDGADINEATELLRKAKEAIVKNNFTQALTLVEKAQLAARPTTEYLLGKANGTGTIRVFLEKLGLEASDDQMKAILEIVKDRSNLVKGNVSEVEFEYLARKYLEA